MFNKVIMICEVSFKPEILQSKTGEPYSAISLNNKANITKNDESYVVNNFIKLLVFTKEKCAVVKKMEPGDIIFFTCRFKNRYDATTKTSTPSFTCSEYDELYIVSTNPCPLKRIDETMTNGEPETEKQVNDETEPEPVNDEIPF